MSYTNADGVYVLTGTDQGAIRPNGTNDNAVRRSLVIDIPDFTAIPATVTTAHINAMDASIPANSIIVGATMIMLTGATSGGSATLDVGTYTSAASAVAATGIIAGAALTAIDGVGEVVRGAGSLVTGTTSTGTAPVYVAAKYNTAAFTAGSARLFVQYIVTGI